MRIPFFVLLLLLLFTALSNAALPDDIAKTFQPADGFVIKGVGGEYLLDLGSDNGVRSGDLIAVMAPKEEIRHPLTGAVIGEIERAKTFLRVERIKPEFSWARELTPSAAIRPADPVRRYGEVPAAFVDQGGAGQPLFNELQLALPHLAWQTRGETIPAGPGLIFSSDGHALTVRDENGTLLGTWPLTAKVAAAPKAETAPAQKMAIIGPRFKGKAIGVAIADLDGHGGSEVAVALDDHIDIGRFNGREWTQLSRIELPDAVKPLTLDTADLDGDGRPELLLSAVRGEKLTSQIWNYNGAEYRLAAKDLPWYWRVMDLPGEESTPLGQAADPFDATRYAERPFRVLWEDGKPQRGESISTFAAPTLHGSQAIRTEQGTLWAWLDSNDTLLIMGGDGERLWQGKESYGGGESFVEEKTRNAKSEARRLFIRSRLATQGGTLILPQNDGSRSLNNWRKAEKSRLVALRWNGYEMEKAWESPTRDGYLADFASGDIDNDGQPEYLLVGTLSTGLFSGTESALFVWPK